MYSTHKNKQYVVLTLVLIIKISDCSSNLLLNRNSQYTFKNPSDYLIINNGRRFCDGATILHATDQIKVEDASVKCNSIDECSFFCQTRERDYNISSTRKIGQMLERVLSKSGDGIPRSSVNWLCSGQNWSKLFVKNGWITGVKGDSIRKLNPLFQFSMNTRAECEDGNILDSAKNLSVNSSCELCKNMKSCTFFTLSFILDDKMMSFSTKTNFCKGSPSNLMAKNGNLLAVLHETNKEVARKSENISNETSPPMYYYGGPITSDHYYDDLKRGSVVPATKL